MGSSMVFWGRDKTGGGGVLRVALKAPGAGAGRLVQNRFERGALGGCFAPSGLARTVHRNARARWTQVRR